MAHDMNIDALWLFLNIYDMVDTQINLCIQYNITTSDYGGRISISQCVHEHWRRNWKRFVQLGSRQR